MICKGDFQGARWKPALFESMSFAQRLTEIMADRDVNQSDLGRALKLTSQAVNQWTDGGTRPVGKRLGLIADVLDVTVSDLMAPPGSPIPNPRHPSESNNSDDQAFNEGVGRRLMWVREIARHTQAQAAEMIGAKESDYIKWESGELAAAPARLLRFCARYRVSMDYIYRATMQGVHPELAEMLLDAHPELQRSTTDRAPDTDTLRRAYMAAIGSLPAP